MSAMMHMIAADPVIVAMSSMAKVCSPMCVISSVRGHASDPRHVTLVRHRSLRKGQRCSAFDPVQDNTRANPGNIAVSEQILVQEL
jgi:hypothetical protein